MWCNISLLIIWADMMRRGENLLLIGSEPRCALLEEYEAILRKEDRPKEFIK